MNVLQMFCVILAALIAYKALSILLLEPLLFRVRNAMYGDKMADGYLTMAKKVEQLRQQCGQSCE